MVLAEALDGVGHHVADNSAAILHPPAQRVFDSLGIASNKVYLYFWIVCFFEKFDQRLQPLINESVANHFVAVKLIDMLYRKGGQRSKKTVGIRLMVDSIHQLGITHVISIMEHAS